MGASYGDGLPNANVTWGYDAAGNRTSDSSQPGNWVYDNLNRMTASPGATYTNDILGNRTSKNGNQIYWDALNRMTNMLIGATPSLDFRYRADGLRVSKQVTAVGGNTPSTTLYRYDGQMGIEDIEKNGAGNVVSRTQYGLGARGIDVIAHTTATANTISYPIYDAHGNMTAQLMKNGSGFTVNNEKSFDAWGAVRSGNSNPEYKGRYCANLGHKQDDESGLIYMRARYYEPGSGRFVSEDPAMDGKNWLIYCHNSPVNLVDSSGESAYSAELLASWFYGIVGAFLLWGVMPTFSKEEQALLQQIARWNNDKNSMAGNPLLSPEQIRNGNIQAAQKQAQANRAGVGKALTAVIGYSMLCQAAILAIDLLDGEPDIFEAIGRSL